MGNLEEKVLWCAMKYALALDEGDATEAVIFTLKPKIPELSDQVLIDMLTAVENYVQSGKLMAAKRFFIPEWDEVKAWLLCERNERTERKRAQDES